MSASAGTAVRRIEDPPLIMGTGSYTDDVKLPGTLHAAFVRAGVAHGSITSIETDEAKAAPGVVGVFTSEDLGLPKDMPVAEPMGPPAPDSMKRPVLAYDRVRFLGEAIAVVVAETRAQAVDAAELVFVDIEPLDVVVDPLQAAENSSQTLFAEHPSNMAFEAPAGENALADAEVVVKGRFVNQRLAAVPMEPGAMLAAPDEETGGLSMWIPTQAPHGAKAYLADALGLEAEQVRVIAPAVGGGFGARIATYPEQVVAAALARKLNKPVRYVESRWETMVSMQHGRAQVQDVEIGAKRDGTVTGLKVRVLADCGAYPHDALLMPGLTGLMSCGVYSIPKVDFQFSCVVTNTTPIGAYRGAGRPEATALVERAMDLLAHELNMDPADVRRKNFIAPDDFPHATVTGANYDSGEYGRALDQALENAGYAELRSEQSARRERGDAKQLGIGMCSYVEWTGFGFELGTCEVDSDGKVTVRSGTSPHGQGHVTAWTQLVTTELGVEPEDVTIVQSDTKHVARGMGTMGSRSLQVGGSAVINATREVLDKAKKIAAHELEASEDDIEVVPGQGLGVTGSPGSALTWAQLAALAQDPPEGIEPGLSAENDFTTPDATFPFGAHIAVVEVDVETGDARLIRHITVDDAGNMTNPLLVEGQVHGGIAQGVAQALLEEIAYDESGNCVTGSLATYMMPSAADLPSYETERTQTPTDRNPLGAKGIGEAGTIGSTPAVQNAVVDALAHLGVTHVDMPAHPERVWRAIQAANGGSPG
jgi:aerobic carbon-monoxide dehydrogenase large subunit